VAAGALTVFAFEICHSPDGMGRDPYRAQGRTCTGNQVRGNPEEPPAGVGRWYQGTPEVPSHLPGQPSIDPLVFRFRVGPTASSYIHEPVCHECEGGPR
jgi:hypothetical protein